MNLKSLFTALSLGVILALPFSALATHGYNDYWHVQKNY